MASIKDDRGYNQMFKPSISMDIRTERRCEHILSQMSFYVDKEEGENKFTILEIGCGTGELAAFMASKLNGVARITGSDICIPFIEEAQRRHQFSNLDFRVLDFNRPETIGNDQFDYVVGNGILHHLYYQLDEALQNILKILKPGGKMIFWEPNLYNPYCTLIFNTTKGMRKWAKLEPDEMALRKGKIAKQIENAGFSNVSVAYKDFLLPNTPAWLIKPVIATGNILEKISFLRWLSQSLFIVGTKNSKNQIMF